MTTVGEFPVLCACRHALQCGIALLDESSSPLTHPLKLDDHRVSFQSFVHADMHCNVVLLYLMNLLHPSRIHRNWMTTAGEFPVLCACRHALQCGIALLDEFSSPLTHPPKLDDHSG